MFLKESKKYHKIMYENLQIVGKEFEKKSYKELLEPAETLSFSKVVKGTRIHFSAECYNVEKNSDIAFCIDVDISGLPFFTRKPSYHFFKSKDGRIYY